MCEAWGGSRERGWGMGGEGLGGLCVFVLRLLGWILTPLGSSAHWRVDVRGTTQLHQISEEEGLGFFLKVGVRVHLGL